MKVGLTEGVSSSTSGPTMARVVASYPLPWEGWREGSLHPALRQPADVHRHEVERGGLRLPQNYCGFGILVVLGGLNGNACHDQCESDEANRHHVLAKPPLMHRKTHAG